MEPTAYSVEYLHLLQWREFLASHGDRVSQRLIGHALESGWNLQGLAWTLELLDDELAARWATGQGLADASQATVRSAAAVLQLSGWQVRFLGSELTLSDLVASSLRHDLVAQARARWQALGEAPESVVLFALLLSGDTLVPRTAWTRLIDGPSE